MVVLFIVSLCIFSSLAADVLSMAISVVCTSLLICCLISDSSGNWSAFGILLVVVGGTLVVFSYFISLTSNICTGGVPRVIFLLLLSVGFWFVEGVGVGVLALGRDWYTFWSNVVESPVCVVLGVVLFLAMVVVVKLVTTSKGPMRGLVNGV